MKKQDNEKPIITFKGNHLVENIAEVDISLSISLSGTGLYIRGSEVVYIKKNDLGTFFSPISIPYLRAHMAKYANYQKFDVRSKKYYGINPPKELAECWLATAHEGNTPVARGIIEHPTMKKDGSIIENPGYDSDTGLIYIKNCDVESVGNPSIDDAIIAIKSIENIFFESCLITDIDMSVAVSAVITAIIRPVMSCSPLHAFTSTTPGSGKTTICDVVSIIATGRKPKNVVMTLNYEESEKRLDSCLLSGDSIILLNNIDRPLSDSKLCQMVTDSAVNVRLFGTQKNIACPNTAFIMANGNNLVISGDLPRRVLKGKLDPGMERPEKRKFKRNIESYVAKNRSGFIRSALIICRAYILSGSPDQNLHPLAGFDDWSNLVRSAMVWAGSADPCESQKDIYADDPERMLLGRLLAEFYAVHEARRRTIRDAIKTDACGGVLANHKALADIFSEIAPDSKGFSARKIGKFFAKMDGRIQGGFRLCRGGTSKNATEWYVTKVDAVSLVSLPVSKLTNADQPIDSVLDTSVSLVSFIPTLRTEVSYDRSVKRAGGITHPNSLKREEPVMESVSGGEFDFGKLTGSGCESCRSFIKNKTDIHGFCMTKNEVTTTRCSCYSESGQYGSSFK